MTSSASWWPERGPFETPRILDRRSARRASELTRCCAHVMGQVGPIDTDLPIVFGSCLGSVSMLFTLLDQMQEDDDGLSPIRFSGSVHHAPVSAVGISLKHTGFVTAIAANEDLVALVLLEALSIARETGEVLVVTADETFPKAFDGTEFDPYAGAVMLRSGQQHSLELDRTGDPYSEESLPVTLRGNPSARLEHVIRWAEDARPGDEQAIAEAENGSWVVRCR